MDIREKLKMDMSGLVEHGAITIVAFGDSVTHGAFDHGVIDAERVYHRLLAKKINALRPYIPVNMINSGIGATSAKSSLARLERQVLAHSPDMVIVSFGLNDVNGKLEDYIDSMREIMTRCKEAGAEVILMTPNMLNTRVVREPAERYLQYAEVTERAQNSGRMDLFMDSVRALARELGVKVADCYAVWKQMAAEGRDTTALLANDINHPIPEMHEMAADILYRTIFGTEEGTYDADSNTLFRGN